jgi:hypothetical protein
MVTKLCKIKQANERFPHNILSLSKESDVQILLMTAWLLPLHPSVLELAELDLRSILSLVRENVWA